MMRALLRPGALVSHALVLVVVAVCVVAGQWQLDRLEQRRDSNTRLEANLTADPVEVTEALSGDVDPVALEFRRVTATGTYEPDGELVLEGREFQGQGGRDVLTPLRLEDGTLVLVRRGWVPRSLGDPPVAEAAPPEGAVELEGYLEPSVPEPGFGPRNPATGELTVIQVPDLPRIAPQLDGELRPMMLRLTAQAPAQPDGEAGRTSLPAVADVAPLDEANHLSYAVQWHSFAVLAVVAYGFWWRRRLREGDGRRPGDAPRDDEVELDDVDVGAVTGAPTSTAQPPSVRSTAQPPSVRSTAQPPL